MSDLEFRQYCALILLEKWADKVFDKQFQREAWAAGLDAETLLSTYISTTTSSLCQTLDA